MKEYSTDEVRVWLDDMQAALLALPQTEQPPIMIGIRSGGVDVGKHLHTALGLEDPLGELNISFYRDDFSTIGLHPVVGPSQMPSSVDGRHILLVDDVLSTGRTVRAAMNEIFDYGRPARITLVVLVQRTGHELPIRADIVGHNLDLQDDYHVSLNAGNMTIRVGRKD